MEYLKKFLRCDRDYFLNNQADVERQNCRVLRIACFFYLLVLTIFTIIAATIDKSKLLTTLYIIYDVMHAALCVAVFFTKAGRAGDPAYMRKCRILLEVTMLSFFLVEAVFGAPEVQSIFFPFPLVLIVMVFAFSIKQVACLILTYVLPFVALVYLFKSPEVRLNDIYIASGTLISATAGYAIVASMRHETGEALSRLRSLTARDALTGLYNKQTFESLCRAFIDGDGRRRGYALLFLDIDKFKLINDRFGHLVGDAVLKSIAAELQEAFYGKDYLCRFGGDEFVVFMADVVKRSDVEERVRVFQDRVHALSKTLKTDDISCSVGIAQKERESETYADLLSRADAALYVAKRNNQRQMSFEEQYFKQSAFMNTDAKLPLSDGEARESDAAPDGERRRAAQRRVLVVDDNAINREMLKGILRLQYEVLEAANGEEALEILGRAHENVSAVLLDLIMPVMDGYEVLRRMRADAHFAKIPVLVTTGDTGEETEINALALGAKDFVVKPYRPAVIMHRLENTINLRETAAIANAVERDGLTGVYRKEFFYKKAEAVLDANPDERFDIVCCDIEHFKLINEVFGEKTGDELLKYLVSLLLRDEMSGRGICGRIGADQFASLLPHREAYRREDFEAAAKSVNQFPVSLNISVCFGIYAVEDASVPVSVMCDHALTAANSVKEKYDVYYAHYDDALRQRTLYKQFITDGMRTGLAKRQFEVYYQPKCNLLTNAVIGAEALVRWVHPQKGLMLPAEFIPIFEANGFITELDRYVWERVCRDLRDWTRSGNATFPVSVNMSRKDIYNPALCDILSDLVKKYELKPQRLHLEITETAYTENTHQLTDVISRLHERGFLIEMDDFGSGYSSLNMLSELPLNMIKLDMRFMQEAGNARRRSVLGAVASLAGELGLPVIAEGVETEEQAETLQALGCRYAQGYYFERPMPMKDFERYLQRAEMEVDVGTTAAVEPNETGEAEK